MKLAALLVLVACGSGIPLPRNASLSPETDEYAADLVHASQTGDVAAIRKLLGGKVVNGGLWFSDSTCMRDFAIPGEVDGGRLDELARCLAGLKLSLAGRRELLDDVVALRYEPGFEIEARFVETESGPWLSWIGYESKLDAADALPTIASDVFDQLRTSPMAETPATTTHAEGAWLKVCIDATGAVTGVHVRAATSLEAGRVFGDAAKQWQFKPFAPRGQPLPVCAVEMLHNKGKNPALAVAPPAIAPPHGEPVVLTMFWREHKIQLDPVPVRLRRQLTEQHIYFLPAIVMVCVATNGTTYGVRMIRPTRLPIYDQYIVAKYQQTHFEPYTDRGSPVAVCAWDLLDVSTYVAKGLVVR